LTFGFNFNLRRYTEAKHVEDAVKSGGLAEIKAGAYTRSLQSAT
jgi:hypothetical protein